MLNQKIYRRLIRGLEQQLWFFGQDTLDRKNNLFEQYGFNRYRTPGHGGSSRYQIPWGHRTVDLHSFYVGIFGNNQDGFLYVRAHSHAYVYASDRSPFPGRYPKACPLLLSDGGNQCRFHEVSCEFLEWLEHYENWIDAAFGKHYRLDCYERYHRKWLVPDQAREWFLQYRQLHSKTEVLQTVHT